VSKTGVNGLLLTEAKYINLSLHYLEQVIAYATMHSDSNMFYCPLEVFTVFPGLPLGVGSWQFCGLCVAWGSSTAWHWGLLLPTFWYRLIWVVLDKWLFKRLLLLLL